MEKEYKSVIESLIFSSDEPIKATEIIRAIKGIDGEDTEITNSDVEEAVEEMNASYENDEKSFRVLKIAEGYSFGTKPEYAKYIGFLSSEKSRRKLSQAALETLAIVAYKQPITKPDIEDIRGVNIDYVIGTLLEKELVTIAGRADTVGRPLLYKTTPEFLKYFGLYNLNDLPKPREIDEIMKDEDFIEQKRKIMMSEVEEKMEEEAAQQDEQESETE